MHPVSLPVTSSSSHVSSPIDFVLTVTCMQTIGRKIHHDSSFPPLRFVFTITLSTYTQGYLCYLFYTHMPLSSIFNSRMKVFPTSKHASHNGERETELSPPLIFDSYNEMKHHILHRQACVNSSLFSPQVNHCCT
jgi:hypothetical protein